MKTSTPIALLLALAGGLSLPARTSSDAALPATLAATGLHEPGSATRVRDANVEFTPRHPLWTDGLAKRRWLYLPPGTEIDKSNPDAWEFPRGTRAWKEFSDGAGRIETRMIERLADGTWRYATYAWDAEGREALLAPEDGVPGRGIPSRIDCLACHEGAAVPILGYSAVQQSAPAATALPKGTREVLGYLHGNCGHCHNDAALPALELPLAQQSVDPAASAERTLASLVGRTSRFRPGGAVEPRRVAPGQPGESILLERMKSRDPLTRMPPLGVREPDAAAIATIERWIANDLPPERKNQP